MKLLSEFVGFCPASAAAAAAAAIYGEDNHITFVVSIALCFV